MIEHVPTVEEVKAAFIHANMGATKSYSKYEYYERAFARMVAEVARAAAEKALVEFADGYERAAEYAKDERSETEPDSSYWGGADDVVEHVIASLRTKASTYRRNEGENE